MANDHVRQPTLAALFIDFDNIMISLEQQSKHIANQFAANPDKFAPQYGGYCAFGLAKGYKAVIDPAAFTVVEDKLYLNYSEAVRSKWKSNIPGYVRTADANWPDVRKLNKVHE